MFEDAGDQPAGGVVAAAHAARVHRLARPEVLVAAEALQGRGERGSHGEVRGDEPRRVDEQLKYQSVQLDSSSGFTQTSLGQMKR